MKTQTKTQTKFPAIFLEQFYYKVGMLIAFEDNHHEIVYECNSITFQTGGEVMQGPLRTLIAGFAAWKLGGGCLSTIAIFLIAMYLLGFVNC